MKKADTMKNAEIIVKSLKEGTRTGVAARGLRSALCLALFASALLSPMTVSASFEPLPAGARAAGMSDAFTVVADDAFSLYYNPAGMLHVRRPEVGTNYSRLFLGLDDKSEISRSFLGYVHPLNKKWGTVGVSYVGFGLSSLYTESTMGLSYAKEVHPRWNVGGSLKFLRKSYGTNLYTDSAINVETGVALGSKDPVFAKGQSKSAVSLDLGTQYRLTKNYALGLALRNVNQPETAVGTGSDKAPGVAVLGLSRWTRVSSLSMEVANWKFADGQDFRVNVGGERWYRSGLGMRAGMGIGSREYRNLALGGSYRMDGFQFDYALNYPLAGVEKTAGTHMVSLTFRFGKPAPDPIEAQLKTEREARLRAEAEMARLRQQLMEITSDKPLDASQLDTRELDTAAQDAMKQAEEEIKRLNEEEAREAAAAAPVQVASLPSVPVPVAPKPAPVALPKPVKPRVPTDLLKQYGDALNFYSNQTKTGAPAAERVATLERILEKYDGKGIDVSAVRTEIKKLKGENSKTSEEYNLSVSYYKRIVQQGTSGEERALLLERIVKKYKPMGVNTAELEKELENLKNKR